MKAIILARSTDTGGGTGRNVSNIKRALEANGLSVEVRGYGGKFWSTMWQMRVAARECDLVVSIDLNPYGFICYGAVLGTRKKFIVIAQAAYAVAPLHDWKKGWLSRLVYRRAIIIAGSSYVGDEIRKKVPQSTVHIIDPGIDMSQFGSVAPRKPDSEHPFMLSVGAVKFRKGHNISIRAFAEAKKKIQSLRYVIVGSATNQPGFFEEMQRLVRELGVERDVDFKTRVSDEELKELYSRATVFVLTSVNQGYHFEGFGMVFLEAAAYGVPSVGTTGNGITDAIEDGKTGILVPQEDVGATARAICTIVQDHELAQRMSARARTFAQEHDMGHLVEKYGAVLRAILPQ